MTAKCLNWPHVAWWRHFFPSLWKASISQVRAVLHIYYVTSYSFLRFYICYQKNFFSLYQVHWPYTRSSISTISCDECHRVLRMFQVYCTVKIMKLKMFFVSRENYISEIYISYIIKRCLAIHSKIYWMIDSSGCVFKINSTSLLQELVNLINNLTITINLSIVLRSLRAIPCETTCGERFSLFNLTPI